MKPNNLEQIFNLGLLANESEPFNSAHCECNAEVGASPCRYCAIDTAIRTARDLWSNWHLPTLTGEIETAAREVVAKADKTILEEAAAIISGPRRESYGDVRESFVRIASVWSSILKATVSPEQVALCMIGLKLMREANHETRDNRVDICGYAALLDQLREGGK